LAIERTIKAVAAAGKCPGILALSPEEEERYGSWGARYFASTTTGLITKAFQEAAQGGRGKLNY
jgi:4-hydroxy-2-oxoheptanedioate aldolase